MPFPSLDSQSLQQTVEALGLFFFFLAREVEKAVSTWKFHSQHLIFRTCGCTHGGAEDRKSTDPEKGNRELWMISAVWVIYSIYVYLWKDLRTSSTTLTQ